MKLYVSTAADFVVVIESKIKFKELRHQLDKFKYKAMLK